MNLVSIGRESLRPQSALSLQAVCSGIRENKIADSPEYLVAQRTPLPASPQAAAAALDAVDEKWGTRYPAIIRLWRNAWEEFIPFLDYDVEIRKVIRSTNAIESLNDRYRRAVKARGHFPSEQSALKCLYLVTRSLDPKGTVQTRWAVRWKPALNAFAITFADRMPAAETN